MGPVLTHGLYTELAGSHFCLPHILAGLAQATARELCDQILKPEEPAVQGVHMAESELILLPTLSC